MRSWQTRTAWWCRPGAVAAATWLGHGPRRRAPVGGLPARPRPDRARLPGHRDPSRKTCGASVNGRGVRISSCSPAQVGWRSLCRLVSRANLAGTKGVPRFSQTLAGGARGGTGCAVRLPRWRDRPSPAGGRSGRGPGRRHALCDAVRAAATARPTSGLRSSSCRITCCRTTIGSWREPAAPGPGARPARRGHQRRPLRPARGSRTARRPDRDPPRADTGQARRPAPTGWRVLPQVAARNWRRCRRVGRPSRWSTLAAAGLEGGDRDAGGAGGIVLGRSRLRAVPLPGLSGAGWRNPVLLPRRAVPDGRSDVAITR